MKKLKPPKFITYRSSNGHTVRIYGRLFFIVSSASRSGLDHFVDLEGFDQWSAVCNCEAWKFGMRPCRHIRACLELMFVPLKLSGESLEYAFSEIEFLIKLGVKVPEAFKRCIEKLREKEIITGSSIGEDTSINRGVTKRMYQLDGRERSKRIRVRPVSTKANKST